MEKTPRPSRNVEQELRWEDLPLLMEELRDMARRLLARFPGMESLQPTLLVATALRRQLRRDQPWEAVTWENRRHFFGNVFRAMEHKLVEYRRHQRTRGYRAQRQVSVAELELYEAWKTWTEDPELAAALADGLRALAEWEPQLAELVRYRFFSGLTWQGVARMQGCSLATVKRDWQKARIFMEATIRDALQGPASA